MRTTAQHSKTRACATRLNLFPFVDSQTYMPFQLQVGVELGVTSADAYCEHELAKVATPLIFSCLNVCTPTCYLSAH